MTAEHEAELTAMNGDAPQLAEAAALMQEIGTFGRLPKEVKGTSEAQTAERNLAKRFNKARAAGRVTAEHEAELAKMMERELGNLSEAESPPDPLDPFANEASNRLEQDLLMFAVSHASQDPRGSHIMADAKDPWCFSF